MIALLLKEEFYQSRQLMEINYQLAKNDSTIEIY